jgi:hypothetical protein
LSRSPIRKALSSIRKSGAKTLLMGGQACVFYGAAEFSRDLDLLVLAHPENLASLRAALDLLAADVIAVPPFDERRLLRGHAVHFRCRREDVAGLRIDVMASLRAVGGFEELWARRTTIEVAGEPIDLLSMEDLVRAKKTQRDKDWPMIRRLVEQSYFERSNTATPELVQFWLRELRTPELLAALVAAHPELADAAALSRPAVQAALLGQPDDISLALEAEEREERLKDREYWAPLKRELEELRLGRRRQEDSRG